MVEIIEGVFVEKSLWERLTDTWALEAELEKDERYGLISYEDYMEVKGGLC